MRSRQNPLYRLLDKDYYETFDAYVPRRADFYDSVASMLPPNWRMQKKAVWFHCHSPQSDTPMQGWKIHISATPANAMDILSRVTNILFRRMDTDFKFALDMSIVFLMNSKNWPRGGSGKFITIYPRDNHQFIELLEELYLATRNLRGPYVLSDHRYKDSGVVFYRYGGMRLYEVVNVKGERTPMLVGPDGSHFPDERQPYPVTPPWASKVLPTEEPVEQSENAHYLKQKRYEVEDVLSFSNAGGVYLATDRSTGKRVVIKEARPCVNPTANGYDAVQLLKKEYRLLALIEHACIAPKPIDLFEEWEHWFLVEEFVEGLPLASHSGEHNILLRTRAAEEDFLVWRKTFFSVCANLFAALEALHDHNIVFADLSTNNVIIEAATGKLKLIDFEGAYELGIDRPTALYTPGFVSQNRLAGCDAAMDDDTYAAGAVLMSYLFPITGFFHLNPKARQDMMAAIQRDSRLPEAVVQMILALMDPDATRRPRPGRISEVLTVCAAAEPEPPQPEKLTRDYEAVVQGIVMHLNDVATHARQDRLFPTDQKLFVTNPLSLAWGAAGVGYALSKVTCGPQEDVAAWILRHPICAERYAPGLYAGISGIAWSLLEMGKSSQAEEIFQRTFNHTLLNHSSDIFYGIAGWGMTCLRFFVATGNQLYLDQARMAGRHLLATCQKSQDLCYWSDSDDVPLGFAHGASGIAVFLLYLYLATHQEEFLATGRRGLEFDLRHTAITKDLGLSWRRSVQGNSPLYPYWQSGSAGVGMSVLRYWRLLGGNQYWSILEKIFVDVDRKYAVFPGRFMGLAGLGDFLLDMHEVSGEARFLQSAHKVAEGIMSFQVERRGIAFPGDSISRLSCSYGNGSAGIAVFLNRLLGERGNHFMLDCLFANNETSGNELKNRVGLTTGVIAPGRS
ncbi:MAG TPA: class III lanthionine synthetase LanKC [Candidatus Angelobacter sp.]|nr:class III lanthionine synthetase LanKC [Candidatus Angelobacter sp.]